MLRKDSRGETAKEGRERNLERSIIQGGKLRRMGMRVRLGVYKKIKKNRESSEKIVGCEEKIVGRGKLGELKRKGIKEEEGWMVQRGRGSSLRKAGWIKEDGSFGRERLGLKRKEV